MGYRVLGPYAEAEEARQVALQADFDIAILDVSLGSTSSAVVAAAAAVRGKPSVFVTGYASADALPVEFRRAPRLMKPVDGPALRAAIDACLGPPESPATPAG